MAYYMAATAETMIDLQKFDVTTMPPSANMMIIGKRATGKSWLVRDILTRKSGTYSSGLVYDYVDRMDDDWSKLAPEVTIEHKYDAEKLADTLRVRQMMIKELNRRVAEPSPTPPYMFVVMDGILDKNPADDVNIKTMLINGRFYYLSYILALQYQVAMPPAIRCNIDYVFLGREANMSIKHKIYDYWAGIFETFDDFDAVMRQLGSYDFLVINNISRSNKLEDVVTWYNSTD